MPGLMPVKESNRLSLLLLFRPATSSMISQSTAPLS